MTLSLSFQICVSEFCQILPKLNIFCDSDKRITTQTSYLSAVNMITETIILLSTVVEKLYENNTFCSITTKHVNKF